MIDLELGRAALAFAGAASPEDQRLIDRLIASGGAARFARRFLEAKGLGPAADALGRFDAADVLPFPNTKTNSAGKSCSSPESASLLSIDGFTAAAAAAVAACVLDEVP